MNIAQKIATKVGTQKEGVSFRYLDLGIKSIEFVSAAKALERLLKKGVIKRFAPGVFYKPQKTVFGELGPGESDLIKPYLFQSGKRIGYITGARLYNQLGITTQVPKNLIIAYFNKRVKTKVRMIEITSVKSYVEITDENYVLLELLDVMKDFKRISDTNPQDVVKFLLGKIPALNSVEQKLLVNIAMSYPPRVRAFTGALVDKVLLNKKMTENLKNSLNPLSEYDYGIKKEYLSTAPNWNIK
jgi:hypothetical protein